MGIFLLLKRTCFIIGLNHVFQSKFFSYVSFPYGIHRTSVFFFFAPLDLHDNFAIPFIRKLVSAACLQNVFVWICNTTHSANHFIIKRLVEIN